MSFVPPVTPQTQVVEQIKALTDQKVLLDSRLRHSEEKLKLIEASLSENENLKARVRELLDQSLGFFQEEWSRKSEYFPDIRSQSLLKIVDWVNPPKKVTGTPASAGPGEVKKT